jgi:hypothetical protein
MMSSGLRAVHSMMRREGAAQQLAACSDRIYYWDPLAKTWQLRITDRDSVYTYTWIEDRWVQNGGPDEGAPLGQGGTD